MNWPSFACGCVELVSSKDWWEFAEPSESQFNIVALQQEEKDELTSADISIKKTKTFLL